MFDRNNRKRSPADELFTHKSQSKRPRREAFLIADSKLLQIQSETTEVNNKFNQKDQDYDKQDYNDEIGLDQHKIGQNTAKLTHSQNIFYHRANKANSVTNSHGETSEFKSAIIIDPNAIEIYNDSLDIEEVLQTLNLKYKTIPSNRPVDHIVETSNFKGSPIKVLTPKKTPLTRSFHYSVITGFTNQDLTPQLNPENPDAFINKISIKNDFFQSQAYSNIKKFFDDVKKQQKNITSEALKTVQEEKTANNNKRATTQNKEMKVRKGDKDKVGSANDYVNSVNEFRVKDLKWEWLHLIAYGILGAQSQNMMNLVAGSLHANTDMMCVEPQIAEISKYYPNGFILDVVAKFVEIEGAEEKENLQIATMIEYDIKTKDFGIKFKFNAQNDRQPHVVHKEYIATLIQVLCDLSKIANEKKSLDDTTHRTLKTKG